MQAHIDSFFTFLRENLAAVVVLLGLLLLVFVRRWPDAATFTFLFSGVRGGRHVEEYRRSLAENVTRLGRRIREAADEQHVRIQAINLERERIQHLVRTNPQLVREVGKALQAVEKEYLANLKTLRSAQAREVLRLATERRINAVLQSLDIPSDGLPDFAVHPANPPPRKLWIADREFDAREK